MIDDGPKALLAFLATALALGRLWIAVDSSSRVALAFRPCWTPQTRRLAWAALGLAAFIAVAEDVVFEEQDELILRLDRVIEGSLTALVVRSQPIAGAISHVAVGGVAVLLSVGLVALLVAGRRADVLTILIGTLTAWGVSGLLNVVCGVQRPFADPVVDELRSHGFPSEYALVTVVALGTMAWVLGRDRSRLARISLWAVAGALALAVDAWRVMIRAHWPSDVLGGVTVGAAWLAMVIVGAQFRERDHVEHPYHREVRHRRPVALEYQGIDVAETYDRRRFHSLGGRYNNWRLYRLLNRILQLLPPGSVVLDIPCGTGRIDDWLLKRSLRVIAADISGAMLDVARRQVRPLPSGLEFLRTDANHLPFRSHSVDGVFSIRFLHLMDASDRRRVLTEVARVAKQWAIVEYRNVDTPVKAIKRSIIFLLTGQKGRRKRAISEIADELNQCGLIAERYYFISRWFSGSVLIVARHHSAGAPSPPNSAAGAPGLA
jgi:ubiquinone/menaquinone biosynthesis C-methylase UbiE/membrane-associated phospholipid phosphatase